MMSPLLIAALLLAPPAKGSEVIHRIRPQALPTPVIPVTLVPSQTAPGDALPLYLVAGKTLPRLTPEAAKERDAVWALLSDKSPRDATPADLALIRKTLKPMLGAIRLIERAVAIRRCDWSPLVPAPPAGLNAAIGDLLPSVQLWRELAAALSMRCYLSRATQDYPAVLADARTLFGMAAHIAQGQTLIQYLVASAIHTIGLGQVRETMNDGGPNLYASLLELPRPAIAVAPAARRELGDLASVFPPRANLDRKALSEAEAQAQFTRFFTQFLTLVNPGPGAEDAKDKPPEFDEKPDFAALPDAAATRAVLTQFGVDPKLCAAMPKTQVYLLDATLRFQEKANRIRLALVLPAGHPLLTPLPKRPAVVPTPAAVVLQMADLILPAIDKCREAEARQTLDAQALIFAEALRAELAGPDAEWGPRLLDAPLVKAVPGEPRLIATWNPERKAFTAPSLTGRVYVWELAK